MYAVVPAYGAFSPSSLVLTYQTVRLSCPGRTECLSPNLQHAAQCYTAVLLIAPRRCRYRMSLRSVSNGAGGGGGYEEREG